MKFRFSLEVVLKHRKSVEKIAVKNFMEAQQKLDECLAAIRLLYESMDDSRAKIAELHKSGGAHLLELRELETFIHGQGLRVDHKRNEARDLMAKVEEKQEILVEAVKDARMMERIKERRQAEFKEKAQKKMDQAMDDMNTMRFRRSGRV